MRVAFAGVVLLAGCDVIFPLRDPSDATPIDAACLPQLTHDEDGDGVEDDCDLCPGDPNPTGDLDGDGVGDACDPDKANPCEMRVLFDGFEVARSQPIRFGAWMVMGGDLRLDDPSLDVSLAHYATSFSDVTMRVAIGVLSFGVDPAMSPFIDISSGNLIVNMNDRDTGYACRLVRQSATVLDVKLVSFMGPEVDTVSFNGMGDDNVGELVFELSNIGGTVSCNIAGAVGGGVAMGTGVPPMSSGEIAIDSHRTAIVVHWVDVIARVPACL